LKKSKVSVKQEEPEPEEQDVNEMDLQYDDWVNWIRKAWY
jgi:hypothetical protein